MKKIYLVYILVSVFLGVSANTSENIKTIKRVRGEYSLLTSSSSLSMKQAIELAREDAKTKAIEEAFGSYLTIWQQGEVSSESDTFNWFAINNTYGEIIDFEIIEEGNFQSALRSVETVFFCEAKVKVKRMSKPDPNFYADVKGIKNIYYINDNFSFFVTASSDCYLKVFLLNDIGEGCLLYPNNREQSKMLEKKKTYRFPDEYSDYRVSRQEGETTEFVNRLVFVFTKTECHFDYENPSRIDIETWIARIPTSEKFMYSTAFNIRE